MARLRKPLLTAGFLLALALAAAFVWREVVVEAAARYGLAAGGLGDARFEVVSVGWTETLIEDLALGPGLPTARRVRLVYAPGELARGRLRAAHVEGLRYEVPADWRAARARLEGLAGGGGGAGRLAVARVALADAVVTLAGREGRIAVEGALDLTGESPGAALDVDVALADAEGRFTLRSEALGAGGVVALAGGGTARLAGMAVPGRPGLAATRGRAEFTLEGTAPVPADAARPAAWLDARLALAGELRLSGVTTAAPGVLSADIAWALGGTGDGLALTLPRPAQATLAGLAPGALENLPLALTGAPERLAITLSAPGPLLGWSPGESGGAATLDGALAVTAGAATAELNGTARLVHGPSGRLAAPAEIAFRAEARGLGLAMPQAAGRIAEAAWDAEGVIGPDGAAELAGPLSARLADLRLAGLDAASASLEGTAGVQGTAGGWTLRLDPGATLAAEGLAMPGTVRLDGPVAATLDRLALGGGAGPLRLDLAAAPDGVSGVLFEGGGEIAFTDAGGRLALDLALGEAAEGEIRVEAAGATLPRESLRLDDADARLRLGPAGEGPALRLAATLRDTGRAARFAPFRVALEGAPGDGRLPVSGTAETLNGALRLPLAGAADLAAGTARIGLGPARVTFREGGLQPRALVPAMALPGTLIGPVGIDGEVAVGPGGALGTRLSLALDGLSLRGRVFEVAGLAGRVTLSGLAPPASAGPQELSAQSLIAGVPIESPRARFTLLPRSRGMAVQIHEGRGTLAGGEVAVADARWDTAAETNSVDIRVLGVSLERLLREWQIEGLSGTGRLTGRIPVRVGPAGLVVEGGRLEAGGAGRIAVDWGAARETLMNSGEQVALTVRALEDFRYDSLTIGVDRPAEGALSLAIGLEGSNPEVLDGYPFRFNITLSGKLEPILAAVREGRRIGADLLRGGLGAGP